MRPRFGPVTRLLSIVFVLAGIGAGETGACSGHQVTPGSGAVKPTLLALASVFLVIGVSLWLEFLWSWWAGLALTGLVALLYPLLRPPDLGWALYVLLFALFVVSGVQGWRDGCSSTQGD